MPPTQNSNVAMSAPWGSIILTHQNGDLSGITPSLTPLITTTTIPSTLQKWEKWLHEYLYDAEPFPSEMIQHLRALPTYQSLTPFQHRVYEVIQTLPADSWLSYSELGKFIGAPKCARAIARCLACNPLPILIPCHRILSMQEKKNFDLLHPNTLRPKAYMGRKELADLGLWLRMHDASIFR